MSRKNKNKHLLGRIEDLDDKMELVLTAISALQECNVQLKLDAPKISPVLEKVKEKNLFQEKIDYAKKSLEGFDTTKAFIENRPTIKVDMCMPKKELEVGSYKDKSWYKSTSSKSLFYLDKSIEYNYGFVGNGEWSNKIMFFKLFKDNGFNKVNEWVEATPKEVEEALIKYANKRGFKAGITFTSPNGKHIYTTKNNHYKFVDDIHHNRLMSDEFAIMLNGNWAEIVQPTIKALGTRTDCFIIGEVTEQTEEYVLINGLKFLNDQVTILSEEEYKDRRKAYDKV